MKLKHLFGIFTFLTCFAVSVLLVGSQVTTLRATKCFDHMRSTAPPVFHDVSETRIKILEFLEKDRQTGIELSRDTVKFRRADDSLFGEKAATIKLVEKMQAVKCDGLPADFCAAWNEHSNAWKQMAIFLSDDQKRTSATFYGSKKYEQLNREISQTYNAMLDAAQKYGVDFSY